MLPRRTTAVITFLLAAAAASASGHEPQGDAAGATTAPVPAQRLGSIAALNGFVENRGQWAVEVLFFARRHGVEVTVTREALVFRPAERPDERDRGSEWEGDSPAFAEPTNPRPLAPTPERPPALVLRLPGNTSCRVVEGLDALSTKHHFLIGANHVTDVPGYERVALRDVLPGVDVVLRADGGALSYDLELAPGAHLEDVAFEVEGAHGIELRSVGALVLHTEAGEVEQRIHAAWQGERETVAARFSALAPAHGRQRFGFEAPAWDRRLALVVDPTVEFLTYVGGSGLESLREVAASSDGSLLLVAQTIGGTPTTPGSFKEIPDGADAWIGKLSPDGTSLSWGTFLGGAGTEDSADLALAPDDSVIVLGRTWSEDFPVTPGAYQTVKGGPYPGLGTSSDVFVARLAPAGDALVWSTFYGEEDFEVGLACALYPDGDVLVGFEPRSADPPSTPGAIDEVFDDGDKAFVRLTADGSQRLWQTYFPAQTIDDLIVDEESIAYFCGSVSPSWPSFPSTPGAFQETASAVGDGFVTKMNANGTELLWSTYLGGLGSDRVWGIDIDPAHGVYVAGTTNSPDFPVSAGAFQITASGTEGFVAKFLPGGSGLAWSSYIEATGFPGSTSIREVSVDAAGNAFVLGWSNEPSFPVTPDAFQPSFIGPSPSSDTLLCRFNAVAEDLIYATWIGGNGGDNFSKLATDLSGGAWTAFEAGAGLKTTPGAYQAAHAGSVDLAVAKFDFEVVPWSILPGGLTGKDLPSLVGLGNLASGSSTRLALRGAPASTPACILAGIHQINAPFLGGLLVPLPTVIVPWTTNADGAADLTFPWPAGAPGTKVYFQVACLDDQAPSGWSASNGLRASHP